MSITFADFQQASTRTLKDRALRVGDHPATSEALVLGALGLAGEAGEAVEHVKKHVFHSRPLDREALAKEIGDVLWYLSALATGAGLDLGACAEGNIEKLRKRYPDGFTPQASVERADETPRRSSSIDDEIARIVVG